MVMMSGLASPPVPISPAKRRGGDGGQEGVRGGMEAFRRLGRRVKPFEQVGVLGFLAFTASFFLLIFYFCSNRGGLSWAGRAAVGAGGRGVKGAWGLGVEIGRSVGDDDGGSDAGGGGGVKGPWGLGVDIGRSFGGGGGSGGGVRGAWGPGVDISRSGGGGGMKGALGLGVDISRSVGGGVDGGVKGAWGRGVDISRSVGGNGGVKGAWGPGLDINRSVGGGGGGGGVGARGGRECDWFEGKWVWDERYPLYKSRDCRFLDDGFRCSENGRRDLLYSKWRWQPAACDLPRFYSYYSL